MYSKVNTFLSSIKSKVKKIYSSCALLKQKTWQSAVSIVSKITKNWRSVPQGIKSLNVSSLPRLRRDSPTRTASYLMRHKILLIVTGFLVLFVVGALWFRSYALSKMKPPPQIEGDNYYSTSSNHPTSAPDSPTPTGSPTPSDNSVLGSSYDSGSDYSVPSPYPTLPPVPTLIPLTTTTSSTSNTSGNSNCTTGSGTPNLWYSDVYPNPPINASNGSVTLQVTIRDCNKNTASVNDNLTISLSSSDSTARVNGSTPPVNIQASNGQASFTVSSQNTTNDTFVVQDTTSSFTITNTNNNNPSVSFTNNNSSTNSITNSNCTTVSGTPNSWYSDAYPASPVSATTGSPVTFTVDIRDCAKNTVSSDSITISQTSSDSSLTINGSAPPVTIQVSNGQGSFTVNSQNAGTDILSVQDTTSSFGITDTNNNNPQIVFSGSSTSTPTPTPNPANTSTPTPSQAATPTPTPTNSPTPSSPTPTLH